MSSLGQFLHSATDVHSPKISGSVPVAISTDGAALGIDFTLITGQRQGPCVCVQAGVHGDEYDGMESVRWLIRDLDPATLRGTVLAIPCLNTTAFTSATRAGGVDHVNLNRTFPGSAQGTITQRLAAAYLEHIVPAVDAVVDLHTGGGFGDITPLTVVQGGAEDLVAGMGKAAGNPILWRGGAWGGTARQAVIEAGKPAVTLEAGGGIYREDVAMHHYRSASNILRYFDVLDGEVEYATDYTWVNGTFARADAGGFARPLKLAGEYCDEGEKLVSVVDVHGNERASMSAPSDGIVLWNRVRRSVLPGDEIVIFGGVEVEVGGAS